MVRLIKRSASVVAVDIIQNKIYFIRGYKVMLDKDLAELYGTDVGRLKEQVRRNIKRFPDDFMIELTKEETSFLRPQFAVLKRGEHSKFLPYAFTEQGVAMLSSVLNSDRAIEVNIQIMRVFTKLRELMISHKDLARKIEDLEHKFQNKFDKHDKNFALIFNAIRQLVRQKKELPKNKGPMGFVPFK